MGFAEDNAVGNGANCGKGPDANGQFWSASQAAASSAPPSSGGIGAADITIMISAIVRANAGPLNIVAMAV